jgi:hypothetical protein
MEKKVIWKEFGKNEGWEFLNDNERKEGHVNYVPVINEQFTLARDIPTLKRPLPTAHSLSPSHVSAHFQGAKMM